MVAGLELLGLAEAAEALGVTKQRVTAMRDVLPSPLAELQCGPIWDRAAIVEFEADWDRRPGRRFLRVPKWHYIEATYRLPGREDEQWRGVLTEATSLKEARQTAHDDALAEHPDLTDFALFMDRTLTPERADRIRTALSAGTWQGWYGPGGPGVAGGSAETDLVSDDESADDD